MLPDGEWPKFAAGACLLLLPTLACCLAWLLAWLLGDLSRRARRG